MNETRWTFIRHAPVSNPNGRIYGASDRPADTTDVSAFSALARRLPADAVTVVSHLVRTQQTLAAIRAAGLAMPEPLIEPRMGEQDFGAWVGKTYEEVRREFGAAYERFWLAPATERAPGGESFVDLSKRVHACILELSDRFAGRDIICVAHGGSIRAALGLALALAPSQSLVFSTDNLSMTMIDRLHPEPGFGGAWRIRGTNVAPLG